METVGLESDTVNVAKVSNSSSMFVHCPQIFNFTWSPHQFGEFTTKKTTALEVEQELQRKQAREAVVIHRATIYHLPEARIVPFVLSI